MNLNWEISPFGPPYSAGVYAICARTLTKNGKQGSEHVLYVGSSSNINKRINNPTHPYRIAYNRFPVYCKFIETDNYLQTEIIAIKKYRPILNKQHNGS